MEMTKDDFQRVILTFADEEKDITFSGDRLVGTINGNPIEARYFLKDGALYVEENGIQTTAITWIKNRIANLTQLAERIIKYYQLDTDHFVTPRGNLLDELEYNPDEEDEPVQNTEEKLMEILSREAPGRARVVYLQSNAGEGKSTLINHLANRQAQNYIDKKADWLLLPIPLGGKQLMDFSDVVTGTLANKLRFKYLFFKAFLELVKLGLIVPAFDGFEELLLENTAGGALSATGNLLNQMESSGTVLMAARNAYFEYKDFSTQAKLHDTIKSQVSFVRLALKLWNKAQFIEYARMRGVEDTEEFYDIILRKLGGNAEHPLLVRAVLVKRVVDVRLAGRDIANWIGDLDSSSNYFPSFVHSIIEREAHEKWLSRDQNNRPAQMLLVPEQHYKLLASLSEEMWFNNTDSLDDNILDLIAEMFCEDLRLSPLDTLDVKSRLKTHALIKQASPSSRNFTFDHEEFKEFFLGVQVAFKILANQSIEVKNLLKKATLPDQSCDSIVAWLKKSDRYGLKQLKLFFDDILKGESQASFVRENIGGIMLRLLSGQQEIELDLTNFEFPSNALQSKKLSNINFGKCHFQHTSLFDTQINNCVFKNCYFDNIELYANSMLQDVQFIDCDITAIYDDERDKSYYSPAGVMRFLNERNIEVAYSNNDAHEVEPEVTDEDTDLVITERALRRFMRSNTGIRDDIFRLRLGNQANRFLYDILPELLDRKIMEEMPHRGGGQHRRFRLSVKFSEIDKAFNHSNGSFDVFLKQFDSTL